MTVKESIDSRIFWDVSPDDLDWHKNAQFIIERVLTRGYTKDVRLIFKIYSNIELAEAVIKSKTLDKKTANFMSNFLNISLEQIHVAPEYY